MYTLSFLLHYLKLNFGKMYLHTHYILNCEYTHVPNKTGYNVQYGTQGLTVDQDKTTAIQAYLRP